MFKNRFAAKLSKEMKAERFSIIKDLVGQGVKSAVEYHRALSDAGIPKVSTNLMAQLKRRAKYEIENDI